MDEHVCEVRGGHLVLAGDFSKDTDIDFDAACQKLLDSGEKELTADLVGMTHICSTYVGLLIELCLSARRRGLMVTVRAGKRIATVLKEAGLESAATLEEAE